MFLVVFQLFFNTITCQATDWKWVGNTNNYNAYIDVDSISYGRNCKAIWVKLAHNNGEEDFQHCWYSSNKMWDMDAYVSYDSSGNVTDSYTRPSFLANQWKMIVPDSIAEAIWDWLY